MNRPTAYLGALAAVLLAACGGPEAGASPQEETAAAPVTARTATSPTPAGEVADARGAPGAPGASGADGSAPGGQGAPGAPAPTGAVGGAAATRASAESAPAPPAPTETAADAAAILGRAERAYDNVRSLEADFVQDLTVPLLETTQRSRGRLYVRRPDRLAMKFTDPAGDLVVADGRYLWMYYPSNDPKQVVRAPLAEAGQQVDLQKEFLSNPTARYNAVLNGTESVGGRPAHVLTLTPRGQSPYQRVKIWVDREDALVRRFEIVEQNESVRRLELRGLRPNASIADQQFRFTPPPGAEVFSQ